MCRLQQPIAQTVRVVMFVQAQTLVSRVKRAMITHGNMWGTLGVQTCFVKEGLAIYGFIKGGLVISGVHKGGLALGSSQRGV